MWNQLIVVKTLNKFLLPKKNAFRFLFFSLNLHKLSNKILKKFEKNANELKRVSLCKDEDSLSRINRTKARGKKYLNTMLIKQLR